MTNTTQRAFSDDFPKFWKEISKKKYGDYEMSIGIYGIIWETCVDRKKLSEIIKKIQVKEKGKNKIYVKRLLKEIKKIDSQGEPD